MEKYPIMFLSGKNKENFMINKLFYDVKKYGFRDVICNWLDTYDLSKLHYIQQYEHFERENDQSTIWHKKFYQTAGKSLFGIKLLQLKLSSFFVILKSGLNNMSLECS